MFPKLLRVGACLGYKKKLWINETSFTEKTILSYRDEQYLDVIARALGFSYEAKFPSDVEPCATRLVNGTWSGVLGMLQRGEVDMAIGDFAMDEERNEEFRLSFPHTILESTFMTRKPEDVPNVAAFLQPFSIQVWFAILACVCLVSIIFHYLLRKKNSVPNLFTSVLGSLVGQAMILTPRRPREYLALTSWILGSAFLYHFYAAVLLSFVTFPTLEGIRTIEDLANGITVGKYECATSPINAYSKFFIRTESPALRLIGYNLKYHENNKFVDYLEKSGGDKKPVVIESRGAFHDFKEYYYVPEDNFMVFPLAYVTRKDFCCGLELDRALHNIWASGLLEKFEAHINYKMLLKDSKEHSKIWNKSSLEAKLTMAMLKGPFIFLIASHSLPFLVFLMEVCIGKFKEH